MASTLSEPEAYNDFTSLGEHCGDSYKIKEDCIDLLKTILSKLSTENDIDRPYRRAICIGNHVHRDIIPLLISARNDSDPAETYKIVDATINILVNLTIPVEYLICYDTSSDTVINELNQLVSTCKEAFTESRTMKAVTDYMSFVSEKDKIWTCEECEAINNCLILLRNILHVSETSGSCYITRNRIIWSMFTNSIDKIIVQLLSCNQNYSWDSALVQLIALLYKYQNVGALQKLLNHWLATSLTESSEDDESNTSPHNRQSNDSLPIVSSDQTNSDSSDNGGKTSRKMNNFSKYSAPDQNSSDSEKQTTLQRNSSIETDTSTSSGIASLDKPNMDQTSPFNQENQETNSRRNSFAVQSEVSDCGYATQAEHQEQISTSSNEDDQEEHQKPHFPKIRHKTNKIKSMLDKKDLRRKKIMKYSKSTTIKMKGLIHHTPTEEDVTHVIKEFTIDFLLKGYSILVKNIHAQLMSDVHIDASHFFWLVTYFLKIATELEISFEQIAPVISYDVISYLVFQGVVLCEDLEIHVKIADGANLKHCVRRLSLVMTAIREFIHAVISYEKLPILSATERRYIQNLQMHLAGMQDLPKLFLMLLTCYRADIQSTQYLQDLILTNHNYLLMVEKVSECGGDYCLNLMDHLKQFATADIMHQYGLLLETFRSNGEYVNNCIFTMMHHVAGDLGCVHALYQPHILKVFSKIWQTDYQLCDDWSDVIKYVIQKFVTAKRSYCFTVGEDKKGSDIVMEDANHEVNGTVFQSSTQGKKVEETVANISSKYYEHSIMSKSKLSILNELLEQNIINEEQYKDFIVTDSPEIQETNSEKSRVQSPLPENLMNSNVALLKQFMEQHGKGHFITRLQNSLLETCYVRMCLRNPESMNERCVMEPNIYCHLVLNLPIPIVAWTDEESDMLLYQPFVLLLHKLGLYLPENTGKLFVRIPNFWTADYIFSIIETLGPFDSRKLKFDSSLLRANNSSETPMDTSSSSSHLRESTKFAMNNSRMSASLRWTPFPCSSGMISPASSGQASCKSGFVVESAKLSEEIEQVSLSDNESVASHLTRMYVSDEDDKSTLGLILK